MPKRLNVARAMVVLGVAAMTITSTGVAHAATSSMNVYHAAGNVAGMVWFNSGTSNMAKGRNSFTVRDGLCEDGWTVYAMYKKGSSNWRYTNGASCNGGTTEFSVSISDDVSRQKFTWKGCKQSENDLRNECEDSVTDYLD